MAFAAGRPDAGSLPGEDHAREDRLADLGFLPDRHELRFLPSGRDEQTRHAAAGQEHRRHDERPGEPAQAPAGRGSRRRPRRWRRSGRRAPRRSVRSTVFIPLATPVSVSGTACTIRLPSAEKASPIPTPSSAELTSMPYGWRLVTASQPQARRADRPGDQRASRAELPLDLSRKRAEHAHAGRTGQQVHPRRHDRRPVAEPGAGRAAGPAGGAAGRTSTVPPPSRNAARLTVHTPRTRIRVMSTSGLSDCAAQPRSTPRR